MTRPWAPLLALVVVLSCTRGYAFSSQAGRSSEVGLSSSWRKHTRPSFQPHLAARRPAPLPEPEEKDSLLSGEDKLQLLLGGFFGFCFYSAWAKQGFAFDPFWCLQFFGTLVGFNGVILGIAVVTAKAQGKEFSFKKKS